MAASFPDMDHRARRDRLRQAAGLTEEAGFLVSDLVNVRYLTGFAGSAAMLLVRADEAVLLTDNRYAEAAAEQVGVAEVRVLAGDRAQQWPNLTNACAGLTRLLFESAKVSVDYFDQLRERLPGLEFVRRPGLVEELRLVKDEGELARIAAAADIAAAALDAVWAPLARGATEREVAVTLERRMVDLGAEAVGFDTIVAAGPHASQPHAHPGDRPIRPGELVVIDFGARVDGYHSDISRTVWHGELAPELARLRQAVVAANAAGVRAARPGATHADVEAACLAALREHGIAGPPAHPAGHNIGLAVHEMPYLTGTARQELMANQVITVEPGVYLPGVGGARVEDMVAVGADGPRLLSAAAGRRD